MRPQSIIGLIVAAIIIVVGLVICMFAGNMASAAGVHLFQETVDGNTKFQEPPFTEEGITKIEIEVSDVTVNIIGGSTESYVELLNFSENNYSYSLSGKTITIKEMENITSMLKFWENGFAFKGVRNILWSVLGIGDKITGDKVINLYISDTNMSIKNISVTLHDGVVNLRNMNLTSDYVVTLNSGTINASRINDSSKLEVIAQGATDISVTDSKISNLLINNEADGLSPVTEGTFTFTNCSFSAADVYLNKGSIEMTGVNNLDSAVVSFQTKGTIIVKGTEQTSPYKNTGFVSDTRLNIVGVEANITYN